MHTLRFVFFVKISMSTTPGIFKNSMSTHREFFKNSMSTHLDFFEKAMSTHLYFFEKKQCPHTWTFLKKSQCPHTWIFFLKKFNVHKPEPRRRREKNFICGSEFEERKIISSAAWAQYKKKRCTLLQPSIWKI